MEQRDIIYAAGIFDGEGCTGVYRNRKGYYFIQAVVSNTNLELLEWFAQRLGGNVSNKIYWTGNRKGYYQWSCSGLRALAFLREIQPYSIVKRKIIEVVLQFPTTGSGKRCSYETKLKLSYLYEQTKQINHRGL